MNFNKQILLYGLVVSSGFASASSQNGFRSPVNVNSPEQSLKALSPHLNIKDKNVVPAYQGYYPGNRKLAIPPKYVTDSGNDTDHDAHNTDHDTDRESHHSDYDSDQDTQNTRRLRSTRAQPRRKLKQLAPKFQMYLDKLKQSTESAPPAPQAHHEGSDHDEDDKQKGQSLKDFISRQDSFHSAKDGDYHSVNDGDFHSVQGDSDQEKEWTKGHPAPLAESPAMGHQAQPQYHDTDHDGIDTDTDHDGYDTDKDGYAQLQASPMYPPPPAVSSAWHTKQASSTPQYDADTDNDGYDTESDHDGYNTDDEQAKVSPTVFVSPTQYQAPAIYHEADTDNDGIDTDTDNDGYDTDKGVPKQASQGAYVTPSPDGSYTPPSPATSPNVDTDNDGIDTDTDNDGYDTDSGVSKYQGGASPSFPQHPVSGPLNVETKGMNQPSSYSAGDYSDNDGVDTDKDL